MGRTLVIMNYKEDIEDPDYIYCMDLLYKTNTELATLLDGVSTLLISGGPQHIPDMADYPEPSSTTGCYGSSRFAIGAELKKEIQLIFLATQRGITVIGICLGFQLINCAFGNPVLRLPAPIIGCGFLDVSSVQTYADPLLECIDFRLLAKGFSFHYDGVPQAVSPELRVVATGPDGIIYFVKHWRYPIYGIQSHPEATLSGILECLERYGAEAPAEMATEEVLEEVRATFFGAFGLTNPLD
jgi:gamma-glutamyl-gamma-aminobutyrate hydrolase PuuD